MSTEVTEATEALPRAATPRLPATDRGEITRRHIMEVAATAFAEGGYAGASLNDIIKDAGVTKGGFYFHFPSKEALALEVVRYKQEQWAGRVVTATMRYSTALEQLDAMAEALCDLYEQDPGARALGKICLELSQDPDLKPQLTPQFTTWIQLTASLVAKGQQEGTIRTDVDPVAVGEMCVSATLGMEMMSLLLTNLADMRQRMHRFVDLLHIALQTPQE
jgi:AcrR family transcriptional regulator